MGASFFTDSGLVRIQSFDLIVFGVTENDHGSDLNGTSGNSTLIDGIRRTAFNGGRFVGKNCPLIKVSLNLRREIDALTSVKNLSNYENLEEAIEGIQSEINLMRVITPDEAILISERVTDWWNEIE